MEGFKKYLQAQGKRNAKQILEKATRYGYVLQTRDARELLECSNTKRRHIMEALVCLSKYLGRYSVWKEIKDQYQLKWSGGDSFEAFQSIFNSHKDYEAMIQWLREVLSNISKPYSNILIFDTLTGLRPTEACHSIRLIKSDLSNYLNVDRMFLEHYRYPSLFLRKSKNAYVSVIDSEILEIAKQANTCTYAALSSYLKKRKLTMHMYNCRKIFATFLRTNGIESEIIDLLQGRVPRSVIVRSYYRPTINLEKVRTLLTGLRDELTR